MAFTKSDLQYQDYSWKTTHGDASSVRGFPDNVLLNRNEGYEVIYFIDRFISDQRAWKDESEISKRNLGQKIERMIRTGLPGDVRSHKNVQLWIANNWASFK